MNFENTTGPGGYPGCTSAYDVNGSSGPVPNDSGGQWIIASSTNPDVSVSPTGTLRYIYDAANTNRGADDWFFLQGLQLTGGTKYRLKFFYKASNGPAFIEKLEVKYGASAAPVAMTELLWENNNINSKTADPWDSARVDFTPAATGVYYIGLHAKSDPDQAFLFLDDVSVRASPVVDAGIPSIVQTLPTCPTTNFVMTANVVNYNLTPLNLTTYPITVTANITGAATSTLTTTVNTGTIAPGDTLKVPLPAFTFNAGLHNITFTVSNPNDSENGNDSYLLPAFVNPTPIAAVFTPAAPQSCAQITTQFSAPPPAPVDLPAVNSGTVSVVIPDNTPAGAKHSLTITGIPAGAQVTAVKVKLNIFHGWVSDMIINLKAPNGKVLNLFNKKGGSGQDLLDMVISSASTTAIPATGAPYTGTYKPDAAPNVGPTGYVANTTVPTDLNGNGAWTLALMDNDLLIGGTLNSWSLEVSYGFPHPVVTWAPVSGLFTDAAGTVPYVAGTNAYSVYANPASETTYTVTSTAAGCSNSSTVTVKPLVAFVNNWPAKICLSDESIALNATPAGGTWSGIGVTGNTFAPVLTAVGSYPLTYRYTNPSGCTVTASVTAKVEDCPERVRLLRDDALILFPNPNNGNFSIRINSVLYNNLTMRVYTTSGLLVQNRQLTNLAYGRVIPIDLTVLPAGSYMVHFYYSGGTRTSDKTFPVIISK
jgi:subtilisin-like proprotein convertase family protein